MDFLSNLYSVETVFDLFILKFGLFFSLLLLLPFLSILIGSLLFSLLHLSKSKNYEILTYFSFSKYVIEIITNRIWVRVLFGVLPFFGVTYFYSQLYVNQQLGSSENLFFAFLLFFAGLCISVVYKNSFNTKNMSKLFVRGGWIAFALLLVSTFILIGYLKLAIVPPNLLPESTLGVLFSANSIIYFLLYISIAFSITSAVHVARMNRSNIDYDFKEYSKEFSIKTGILFTFVQPLLFVLNLISAYDFSLSFGFFISSLFVLTFMLLISIQFYLYYRGKNLKSTTIVFVFMLLFTFLIYNAQISSERAHHKEAVQKGFVLELFS